MLFDASFDPITKLYSVLVESDGIVSVWLVRSELSRINGVVDELVSTVEPVL